MSIRFTFSFMLVFPILASSLQAGNVQELLDNGNFHYGDQNWAISDDFQIDNDPVECTDCPNSMIFADQSGNPGNNLEGQFSQFFEFPENVIEIELSFQYLINSSESGNQAYDYVQFALCFDQHCNENEYIAALSNLDVTFGFEEFTWQFPQEIIDDYDEAYLLFWGQTDVSFPTFFRFDEISVEAQICEAPEQPVIDKGSEIETCDEYVTLIVENSCDNCTYEWSDGQTGISATFSESGSYHVTAENPCNETAQSQPTEVEVLPDVALEISPAGKTICEGESVNFNASGAETYQWTEHPSLEEESESSVTATPEESITYQVTGSNDEGCTNTLDFSVSVLPSPQKPEISRSDEEECLLISSANTGNQWYIDGNPIEGATASNILANTDAEYSVRTENEGGCSVESEPLTVECSHILSSIEEAKSNETFIYPNPATDVINIRMDELSQSNGITIFSANGREIKHLKPDQNKAEQSIDIANFESGMYFILIEDEHSRIIHRENFLID